MKKFIAAMLLPFATTAVWADTQSVKDNIEEATKGRFPASQITVRREVPLDEFKGFYEVSIAGQNLLVHESGKYAVIGDVFDFTQMANISQDFRNLAMAEKAKGVIAKLDESNFITFTPSTDKIGTLYAFTDPTCGYCRRMHNERDVLLSAGVEIKYIPYPRGGLQVGEETYEKSKQMMCSDTPQQAITELKNGVDGGKYVQQRYDSECVAKVREGYRAGGEIGISGTPFMYLSTGKAVPGYIAPVAVIAEFKK